MQRNDHNVREYLTSAIERGAYTSGSRLPTERELCEQLSVSRSAVRNALAVLEGEGRIVRIAGSGTYVSGPETEVNAANRDFRLVTSPAQVMEARLTIEPLLSPLVAANATSADLAEIARCHHAGMEAGSLEEFEKWDAALHQMIAEATRNPIVIAAYNLVTRARDHGEWGALKKRSLTDERRLVYQSDHEKIVAALSQRDASLGEQEMRKHLLRVRSNLLGL